MFERKKKLLSKAFVKLMLHDLSIIQGNLLGFDKHMNIIIWQGHEFVKKEKNKIYWETRSVGLRIIRGDMVLSLSLDTKNFF
jgi:small nuclear ribonucleoprotein (snRNP)-like protein